MLYDCCIVLLPHDPDRVIRPVNDAAHAFVDVTAVRGFPEQEIGLHHALFPRRATFSIQDLPNFVFMEMKKYARS